MFSGVLLWCKVRDNVAVALCGGAHLLPLLGAKSRRVSGPTGMTPLVFGTAWRCLQLEARASDVINTML